MAMRSKPVGLLDAGKVLRQLAQPSPGVIPDPSAPPIRPPPIPKDDRPIVTIRYETQTRRRGVGDTTRIGGGGPVSAPVNISPPTIGGITAVGSILTASTGTWNNSPTSYTYQWMRGVPDVAPVNTVAPAITGSLSVGATLTVSNGTWTGTAPITYARQWKRDGVNISGATASTYVLVSGDLGKMISATVIGTNAAGNASANSNSVGPVVASGEVDVDAWKTAVGAAGGTVSAARETAVTNFVTSLKSAGVWATMDRYWLYAGENAGAAKVDIVARASSVITGTPVFTANRGYVTSPGNNVTTDFTPSLAGGHQTLNSSVFGGFVNTDRTTGSGLIDFGCSDAGFAFISGLNTYEASYLASYINQGPPGFGLDKNRGSRGSWIIARTGATIGAAYYNGSSTGYPNGGFPSGTIPISSGLPTSPFGIGCLNAGGTMQNHSGSQISSFFVAGGWNDAQALAFYNAERTLLTAIGVLP
jgi:hypothetical protein